MPYRIDLSHPGPDALDTLIQMGALDIEPLQGGLAAIMPDGVTQEQVAGALADSSFKVSAAVARDNGSVWLLKPGTVHIGSITIASPETRTPAGALKLIDSDAFGTGHHPTT
ncbi:MAG: hypothetical protein ACJ74Y_15460, partial [Bryobacteraceae bacterium]